MNLVNITYMENFFINKLDIVNLWIAQLRIDNHTLAINIDRINSLRPSDLYTIIIFHRFY